MMVMECNLLGERCQLPCQAHHRALGWVRIAPSRANIPFRRLLWPNFRCFFFALYSHLKNYLLHVIAEKRKRWYIDTLYGSKTWVRLNISYTISVHHNGIIITSITAVTRSPQTKSITGQSVIQDRSKLVKDVLGKFYDVFDNDNYNDNDIIYVDLPAARTEWSDLSRLRSRCPGTPRPAQEPQSIF